MLFLFSDVGEDDAPTRIRVLARAAWRGVPPLKWGSWKTRFLGVQYPIGRVTP